MRNRAQEAIDLGLDLNLNIHWLSASEPESFWQGYAYDETMDFEVGVRAHDAILEEAGIAGFSWSPLWDMMYAADMGVEYHPVGHAGQHRG